MANRRFAFFVTLALVVGLCRVPGSAQDDQEPGSQDPEPPGHTHVELYKGYKEHDEEPRIVPLPLVTFSQNRGASYGAAAAIIPESRHGSIQTILIPALFWNAETKYNALLHVFNVRGPYHHEEIVANVATTRNRFLHVHYENLDLEEIDFLDGVDAELNHRIEGRSFFRGFGNDADNHPAGNYSEHLWNFHARGFWQLTEDGSGLLFFGPHYDDTNIHTGIVSADDDIDKIDVLFPGLPGREDGSGYVGARVGFVYDTRDVELVPRTGSFVSLFMDYNQKMRGEGPAGYTRFGVDARHYFELDEDISLAVRGAFEGVSRDRDLPFYLRPQLGGVGDLRVFDHGRWRDFYSVVLNFELRIHVLQFDAFGIPLDLEMGPALDVGTVFNGFSDNDAFENLNVNPGFHIRVLNRPNVSMGVVVAYGRDGIGAHVGFGLPF